MAAQTSAIERALALAHPPRSPWTRRAELLHAVTDHDAGAARDLILLDLRFDADAGTWCRRDDYLRADLALLDAGFGAESRRVRELKALVLLDQTLPPDSAKRSRRTSPNPTSFKGAKEELSRLELIGHDPFMALEPPVARRLFDLFVETGYSTATEILDVFTDVFEDKIHWERGDQESLRTYCQLLEAADRPQRADVARYGWDRYAEPQCAAILIEASMAAGSPDAELVETSLATCPGDERLLRLAVNLDERAGRLPSVARLSALLIATANSSPSVQDMDRLYTELERSLQAESESR